MCVCVYRLTFRFEHFRYLGCDLMVLWSKNQSINTEMRVTHCQSHLYLMVIFEAFRSSKTIEPNDPRDVFPNNEIFANDFLCDRVVSDCTLVITSQVRHHAQMRDRCVHVFCIRFLACRKCASVKPMFQPFLHVHFTFSN